jgi:adenine-specific DNA-methyltransferase
MIKFKDNIFLYKGDCLELIDKIDNESIELAITSPPYAMNKNYEKHSSIDDFIILHEKLFDKLIPKISQTGNICWQVGYHVSNGNILPLDYIIFDIVKNLAPELKFKNRIIWNFGHGYHCRSRFSGRHEVILWFAKSENYIFNLDSVRIPQKYPGKKHYKGPNKGKYSGNPLGKNPSDVWEIPNVKAQHPEKTIHPCQFPIALVRRIVKALSTESGIIFDPFMGVGSTGVAAILENRKFIGSELNSNYYKIALERIEKTKTGNLNIRDDIPIYEPKSNEKVAIKPSHFK